jgi:hypothetical protein
MPQTARRGAFPRFRHRRRQARRTRRCVRSPSRVAGRAN